MRINDFKGTVSKLIIGQTIVLQAREAWMGEVMPNSGCIRGKRPVTFRGISANGKLLLIKEQTGDLKETEISYMRIEVLSTGIVEV